MCCGVLYVAFNQISLAFLRTIQFPKSPSTCCSENYSSVAFYLKRSMDMKSSSDQAAGSYKLTLSRGGGGQRQYEMHPIGDRRIVPIFPHVICCLELIGRHLDHVKEVPAAQNVVFHAFEAGGLALTTTPSIRTGCKSANARRMILENRVTSCLAKFGMLACKQFHSVHFVPCGIPRTTTRQLPWGFTR